MESIFSQPHAVGSCLYCSNVLEEDDLNEVSWVGVCSRRYLTWADYVSMIEDQDKSDEWSNNKLRAENTGVCLMLATNSS